MLKSYCNLQKINLNVRYAIWTRSKHDEIVDLMTKETCKEDKTPASKGLVVQPIVSKEFNSRGQMDLILSYNDYRYIIIMSKSFLNPVFVLSLRSSSVLIFEIISSGKEDEVRSTFASTPNITLYGVRLTTHFVI
jgi:hypothetical protein